VEIPPETKVIRTFAVATTVAGVEEKLVYKPVFEAFWDGLTDRATPAFRDELKALGLTREKLLPGYPYDVWEKAVLAGAKLFAELSPEDGVAEVGRRMCLATIDASPVGKTLLPLLKLMGVVRALKRVYSKSTSENYNVVTFGEETPKSLVMHMSWVGNIPDMARGSIVGMGQAMGIPLRAKTKAFVAPKATYLIEWD
jgi:uncharacterized protein (TIGR02265 family)